LNETDDKRRRLLVTAQSLFFKHGIRRVSVEEICREAEVSKMTFYKHFRDKNDLIRAILDVVEKEGLERYRAIMKSDDPFPEKVKAMVRLKMEQTEELSREFYVDIHRHADQEIILLMDQMEKTDMGLVERDFARALKQGHLRAGIHPEFIVYFLNKIVEMSHDETLLRMYPSPQAMIMELTNFFFYGILPAGRNERQVKIQ
jgi:AcrR family transcriptional regulator